MKLQAPVSTLSRVGVEQGLSQPDGLTGPLALRVFQALMHLGEGGVLTVKPDTDGYFE